MQNMQGIRGQMNVPISGNLPQSNIGPNSMGNNMGNINQMNINMGQMASQAQMNSCLPGQLNQIPQAQMQMNTNLQGQAINSMSNVPQMPINSMNQSTLNVNNIILFLVSLIKK